MDNAEQEYVDAKLVVVLKELNVTTKRLASSQNPWCG